MRDAAEEAASLKSEGFKAMKMFVGLLPIRQDLQRVSAVREAIGPKVCLLSSVVFIFVFKESPLSSVFVDGPHGGLQPCLLFADSNLFCQVFSFALTFAAIYLT